MRCLGCGQDFRPGLLAICPTCLRTVMVEGETLKFTEGAVRLSEAEITALRAQRIGGRIP